jgi:hypothetical protein
MSYLRRLTYALAALLVTVVGGLAVATPAAAVSDPVVIQNAKTYRCVDHHYAPGPTTTVYSWPCHYENNPPGNQQWGLVWIGNTGTFRIINHRSNWCLSEPNADFGRIYAEVCDSSLPAKQKWRQAATPAGYGTLKNEFTQRCMSETGSPTMGHGELWGADCTYVAGSINTRGQWHWQPRPWVRP